ncbi:unnamed protein product [Discosporangium mesarthrocarpum]
MATPLSTDGEEEAPESIDGLAKSLPSMVHEGVQAADRRCGSPCLYLKVTVVEGKALTGEMAITRTPARIQGFVVHIQFNGQRARTVRLAKCSVEPKFGEVFVFPLAEDVPSTPASWASFLQWDMPLHLCLTREAAPRNPPVSDATVSQRSRPDCSSIPGKQKMALQMAGFGLDSWKVEGSKELVGIGEVDWRRGLVSSTPGRSANANGDMKEACDSRAHTDADAGGVVVAVPLSSATPDSIFCPVGGILHLRLEVLASPVDVEIPFTTADVERVMDLQESTHAEAQMDFFLYAKAWWEQYSSISPSHAKREVKIFAKDDQGRNFNVCSFLSPAQYSSLRLLETPRHAARFVSLLPYTHPKCVGQQCSEVWKSHHAFLASGAGGCTDHALLLCSLLLGFGLNAYVCVGEAIGGAATRAGLAGRGLGAGERHFMKEEDMGRRTWVWVCTFSGPFSQENCTFWESLTGLQYKVEDMRKRQARTVGGKRRGKAASTSSSHKRFGEAPAAGNHHFSRIVCMFSHREFYANKQVDDHVDCTRLDLSDPALWKRMDPSRLCQVHGTVL